MSDYQCRKCRGEVTFIGDVLCSACKIAALEKRILEGNERQEVLEKLIDGFWLHLDCAYHIETREWFEARIKVFGNPLMQALHHVWKRDPNVKKLEDRIVVLEAKLGQVKELVDADKVPSWHGKTVSAVSAILSDTRKPLAVVSNIGICPECHGNFGTYSPDRNYAGDGGDKLICDNCETVMVDGCTMIVLESEGS